MYKCFPKAFGARSRDVVPKTRTSSSSAAREASDSCTLSLTVDSTSVQNAAKYTSWRRTRSAFVQLICAATHTHTHTLVSRCQCCCRLTGWRVCLTAVWSAANTHSPFKISSASICRFLFLSKGGRRELKSPLYPRFIER